MKVPTRWILLAWACGALAVTLGAFGRDAYADHVLALPGPRPYPYAMIATYLAIMSAEVLAFAAVIRPMTYRSTWGRSLAAAALAFALAVGHALTLMHAAPYVAWHFLWLLAVSLAFAAAAVVSYAKEPRGESAESST